MKAADLNSAAFFLIVKLESTHFYRKLKWPIVVLSFAYLLYSLWIKKEQLSVNKIEVLVDKTDYQALLSVLFLMLLNWGLESIKLYLGTKNFVKTSLLESCKAVFAGIATGIFTPNRVGEVLGRLYFFDEEFRIKLLSVNFLLSISQLLITLLAGVISICFWSKISTGVYFVSAISLLIVLALIMYWNNFVNYISKRIKFASELTISIKFKTIKSIVWLSFFRYLVFFLQMFLTLRSFNVLLPINDALVLIPVFYLLLTTIPTISWGEVGIRGSVALFVFGSICNDTTALLASSTFLWIVNIALPALIGVLFISYKKAN